MERSAENGGYFLGVESRYERCSGVYWLAVAVDWGGCVKVSNNGTHAEFGFGEIGGQLAKMLKAEGIW